MASKRVGQRKKGTRLGARGGRAGRGRPPAGSAVALSRDRLVLEALALLDRHGAQAFSLRRLAEHLGVTPMAIYNHVNGKRDLLQAVAEHVVSGVSYPSSGKDWQDIIRRCFRSLRRACLAHPGAVPLIESAEVLPAAIFRPLEITLTLLEAAGLSPRAALRAYFLLVTFTLGQASHQIRGWGRGVDPGAAIDDGRLSRERFPATLRAVGVEAWDFDASFEFGLSIILAGLDTQRKARAQRAPS
jgi:TetR/AcrR family tetracycline transcriptional repressor